MRPLPGLVDESGLVNTQRREAIANSLKPIARVMDFTGNAGRHKLAGISSQLSLGDLTFFDLFH
jgi:hypothetical protein